MSEIYVFSPDADDLTTFGLVGALEPLSCVFTEEANGMSEITMEHPLDSNWGKYSVIQSGCLLVCDVPVRMTPEINGTSFVTAVEKTTLKTTATKAQRYVYKKNTTKRNKKLKLLAAGSDVLVVERPSSGDFCKVKISGKKSITGWMYTDALNLGVIEQIPDNANGIEEVAPSWSIRTQVFRIYSIEKGLDTVKVSARHISYDLLGNLTMYKNDGTASISTVLDGILDKCVSEHDFVARTNMLDTRTGFDYFGKNPVNAFLDPDEGVCAKFACSMIRDNWELTFLKDAGMNRGIVIEYGKNLTGIKYTVSDDDVCTMIIPVGTDKNGNRMYLDTATYGSKADVQVVNVGGVNYCAVCSQYLENYDNPKIQFLEVSDAKVDKQVTIAIARARMYAEAQQAFSDGADLPEVSMDVQFVDLGETAEYAQYKGLERLFCWDYVTIKHKDQSINALARVVSIEWDVLAERMDKISLGKVGASIANSSVSTWQIPSGFNGSKIAYASVGANALQDDSISTRHIQALSIGADQIAANAITASKIAAGAITVNTAVIDNLIVKANDGNYYKITTNDDGDLVPVHVDVTQAEIDAGISQGLPIVNTSVQITVVDDEPQPITGTKAQYDFGAEVQESVSLSSESGIDLTQTVESNTIDLIKVQSDVDQINNQLWVERDNLYFGNAEKFHAGSATDDVYVAKITDKAFIIAGRRSGSSTETEFARFDTTGMTLLGNFKLIQDATNGLILTNL